MKTLINNIKALAQIVCDPENQPHQFMGDENGLIDAFSIKECDCTEPPDLDNDDIIIRICGQCKKIVTH